MLSLVDLKAKNLPRCTPDSIGMTLTEERPGLNDPLAVAAERAAIMDASTEYLRAFVFPGDRRCVSCGNLLGGVLGSFAWGLAYGEGKCCLCGYPARAIHRIETRNGSTITLRFILQYHPDDLEERKEDDNA